MQRASLLPVLLLLACGPSAISGTSVVVDTSVTLAGDHFFDYPWPSDERVDANGSPDTSGFPNPPAPTPNPLVAKLATMGAERPGFPVVPAAYFLFDAPLAARDAKDVVAAKADSPVVLVDVDPNSPERGKLFPVVATTLPTDVYSPPNLLAVAPRPGIVLTSNRTYAFFVMRSLNDAAGTSLGVPLAVAKYADGDASALARAGSTSQTLAKSFDAIAKAGLDAKEIAAVAVFTTGDVVSALRDLSERVNAAHPVTIDGLHFDSDAGDHPRFCELVGTVTFPQFQQGTPPFDTDGLFAFGADGLPIVQRTEVAPITITLPRSPMPPTGYPLMAYFHGSGATSLEVVDRGHVDVKGGTPTAGEGPAYVVAPIGLATASAAFPLNPERFPGASDFEYLNLNNLAAVRDTFRQGVLEQRMFLEALRTLQIPSDLAASCSGATLPDGATSYHFDPDTLVAMGHSMGAMYLNMISAIEPRIQALVASGAGGYWTYFLMETSRVPDAPALLGSLLGTDGASLSYLHPAMQLAELDIETSDPLVFTPRVSRRTLPGFPTRPIYEPTGLNDSYFPPPVLDAVATGYAHREAGEVQWSSMQDALSLVDRAGLVSYPVTNDVTSEAGAAYTGVVVQYQGDGIADAHNIAFQLDDVKFQYGCFLETFLATGAAIVPAPAALGTPCSE